MTREQQIAEQMRELQAEKRRIEDETFQAEVLPKLKAAIGNTYAYRNNSRGRANDGEYWDVFRKLVAVEESEGGASLLFQQVQTDYRGKPQLEIESQYVSRISPEWSISGWMECREDEFDNALAIAMAEFSNPKRRLAYLTR
jgi:hypothetical protein